MLGVSLSGLWVDLTFRGPLGTTPHFALITQMAFQVIHKTPTRHHLNGRHLPFSKFVFVLISGGCPLSSWQNLKVFQQEIDNVHTHTYKVTNITFFGK